MSSVGFVKNLEDHHNQRIDSRWVDCLVVVDVGTVGDIRVVEDSLLKSFIDLKGKEAAIANKIQKSTC